MPQDVDLMQSFVNRTNNNAAELLPHYMSVWLGLPGFDTQHGSSVHVLSLAWL